MITVDSNLLVYAYNAGVVEHEPAREWLAATLSGQEPVHFAWSSLHAFLRITTNGRVFDPAFTSAQSIAVVHSWLALPHTGILDPGARYWTIFSRLIVSHEVRRDLVIDAHLAALAIEHDATLYTADRDFERFDGLRTVNPLI